MRLAVDASVLVAEALRVRGRRLLANPSLDLFVADEAWDETQHELSRRVALLVERGRLEAVLAEELLGEVLKTLALGVTRVPAEAYSDQMEEAMRRIPHDLRDAPTVALAMTLGCGIWTADRDVFGCGVPVWTTETLTLQLGPREGT